VMRFARGSSGSILRGEGKTTAINGYRVRDAI
jgi:hypothetical protein